DYRRLTSVTPPVRGFGDGSPHTTNYYYSDPGRRDNYVDTNTQASWLGLPSGKLLHTVYDDNWRKSAVTVGAGTADSGTTSYIYDLMGRKQWVAYPLDSGGVSRSEGFTYDDAGRLETFKNRAGNYQTFTYDALNRMTRAGWDDGVTPRVDFTYDAASRVTTIN